MLKSDYHEELDIAEAKELAVKVLAKTMDCVKLTEDRVELLYLTFDEEGEVIFRNLALNS
jgi:20S proteasome subunit alpha 3